jgi:hypothetical protein
MTADPNQLRAQKPEPRVDDPEQELTDAFLEESPEGRGPAKRIVNVEIILVWIAATIALGALVAITLATKPSYGTLLTIAIIGLGYAVASPVIVASLLRRRDEVQAHHRAHELVEGAGRHEGRVRRRAFYWSDNST